MGLKEWIELFAVAISAASLCVSILAFRRARSAERWTLAETRTQAYLTFRDRFNSIKRDIAPSWTDKEWLPKQGTVEWRQIEAYWQNAFDEWFVCTRLKHGVPRRSLAPFL